MGKFLAALSLLMSLLTFSVLGQPVSETSFSFGISKTSPAVQSRFWDEPLPIYLKLGASKSWYAENKRISLRKEVGLNLQYAKISLTSGGLGGQSYLSGNIISLFADAALMANIRVTNSLSMCIGPEAEFLAIGKNHLIDSYSISYPKQHCSGETHNDKINRQYFQEPSYGIRMRLYESSITDRVSIGIAASYLWTKRLSSNFYAENNKRISIYIGFKNKNKEIIPDPQN